MISTRKILTPLIKRVILVESSKASLSVSSTCLTKSRRIKKHLPGELPVEVLNKRHAGIGSFQAIIDKGFNQGTKAYNPPNDVSGIIIKICQEIPNLKSVQNVNDLSLNDPLIKYKVLTKCIKEFDHDIPNSILHCITNGKELTKYYSTPIQGLVSYDQMVRDQDKLPKNLHVIPNPVRFDPETDTFFGGINAFPNNPCVVASLRHKKKYKGHSETYKWPDV